MQMQLQIKMQMQMQMQEQMRQAAAHSEGSQVTLQGRKAQQPLRVGCRSDRAPISTLATVRRSCVTLRVRQFRAPLGTGTSSPISVQIRFHFCLNCCASFDSPFVRFAHGVAL
jgi:hypothetical protein